jgi:chromosome partitioning protein
MHFGGVYMIKLLLSTIKGGTGKTNTAFQVIANLSERGYKCIALDCDGQNNLTKAMLGKSPPVGLYELLTNQCNIEDIVYTPYPDNNKLKNIDIIPANYNLFNYKTGKPTELLDKLSIIDKYYDICIIDSNPSVSAILTNAIVCASKIIGVLDASLDSIEGFDFFKDNLMDEVKEVLNPNLEILGILLNNNNRNTQFSAELLTTAHSKYKDLMFNTMITPSTIHKESRAARLPLIEYCPRHQATLQINDLTIEIIKRLGLEANRL